MTPGVLVLGDLSRTQADRLRAVAGDGYEIYIGDVERSRDATVEAVIGATKVDQLLERFGRLRWIHSAAAGADATLTPRLVDSTVQLTSATGNGGIPLAEHALMLMLMLNRGAPRWLRAQQVHRWDRYQHGELHGSTVGIVGLGTSGSHLAGATAALGMRVLALARQSRASVPAGVDVLLDADQLEPLLRESDFVVICVPLTDATRKLIGAQELQLMRPSAHLICITRGGIIDDDALLAALRDGTIAGAGLDAHGQEPLGADSPFWDLPNVIITPHNGATTAATADRGFAIALDNLRRYAAGLPLRNLVDKEAGY